ncbi:MAG: sensor-containing diguanylate cyclase/phosphodiesterase [Proteobacteria bacterium]|nr:sensor-containing diguanylate cyclase/phosphodiesterase [Pseudomonadota bacterium]
MEAWASLRARLKKLSQGLPDRGSAAAHLIALALIGSALFVRLAMAPVDAGLQYVTFFPAVTLAAVIGGFWPGLLATFFGIVFATFFFTPPYYSFSQANLQTSLWSNLVFLIDGLIVCSCIEAMYRYQAQSAAESEEARRQAGRAEAINQALRDSEAFSHSIFDSRPEQVAVLDQDGVIIAINEAWTRFAAENEAPAELGKALGANYLATCRAAAQGANCTLASQAEAGIRAVLEGRSSEFNLEYPCHSPRQERWFNLRATPLHGARRGVVVAHENISQRKCMEKTLMHHAAIVQSSADAIIGKTLDGIITSWNEGAERLFGYSGGEALGHHISLIAPAPHEAPPAIEEIGHGAALKSYQTVRRRKNGELLDISVTISPVRDASGQVVGTSMVARDISEQKHLEQELRIAATAFDAHEGMLITDADKIILRVNLAFTQSTGYAADEVVGRHVRLLNSGRQTENFYAEMWQSIERDGAWQGEVWNRRKNGEIYPEWLTITAVRNAAGQTTHYVGTHTDITARKAAEDEIRHLAFYDPLTRLPNRRLLMDRLHQAQLGALRQGTLGALMFIDLDNFKRLNDTLGHEKGDLLLQQVAHRLTSCVREGDTVARLGGDEFVVVLANLSPHKADGADQAETVGEKILVALRPSYQLGDHEHHCTSSIGVTLFGDREEATAELMKQADLAMYQAKAAGRNALRFFDPEMQATVIAHLELEKELHGALREGQLILHYQAQIEDANRLTGAEALVRWQHPQRGLLFPADFIGLAEQSGLILPLGQQVLEIACSQLAAWASRPPTRHLSLAVNISGQQIHQPDFVDQVLAVLERTGADPRRLKLELTESHLLTEVEDSIAKISKLRDRGVNFALDDFGTGYSSLACLKRLPLEKLKIDRTFVRNILTDPDAAAIARTVIALAHSLGLTVIAEGVENEGQRQFLAENGCHWYQGYLFSRPLALAAFEEYIDNIAPPERRQRH